MTAFEKGTVESCRSLGMDGSVYSFDMAKRNRCNRRGASEIAHAVRLGPASNRRKEMPESTAKQDRADRKLAKYISRRNLTIGITVLTVVILTAILYASFGE